MHKRKFSVLWSDITFLHTQHHPSAHTAYICMYITVLYQSTPSPSPSLSCPPSHIHTLSTPPLLPLSECKVTVYNGRNRSVACCHIPDACTHTVHQPHNSSLP